MSAVGYDGLRWYKGRSTFVGLYEDNEDMTASSIATHNQEVMQVVSLGNELLYNAERNGVEYIILLDYDSARPEEESRLMVYTDNFSDSFVYRIGKEKGILS